MGTGFECEIHEEQEGIIPRAVRHLFASINDFKDNPYDQNGVCMDTLQFSVGAQFMELYNEEIIDLLDPYNKVCINSHFGLFFPLSSRRPFSLCSRRWPLPLKSLLMFLIFYILIFVKFK